MDPTPLLRYRLRDFDRWALALLSAMVGLLAALALPAAAQDGPLTLLTTVPVVGIAHDVDLNYPFMYVATEDGLTVVDISTPSAPAVRGSVATPTGNMGVKVRGQYAYMAGVTGGLRVVDVSDPWAPSLEATRYAPYAYDVALKDDIAYVSSIAGELYVFDISAPANPVRVKTLGLPAWGSPGPDAQGLYKLNLPVTAGSAKATGVSVSGNYLVTTDWGYGRIYLYDVTTAATPVFAGTHYVPYVLKAQVVPERDVIFMLSAYGPASGIYTVPLSYLAPNLATSHDSCFVCGYLQSTIPALGIDQGGLAAADGGQYLVYGGGRATGEFSVADVSDPLNMSNVETLTPGTHGVSTSEMMGIRILSDWDLAFFAAGSRGVQVYQYPGLSREAVPPPADQPRVTSFAINAGATSTTSRTVTLNNTASLSPSEYRASQSSDLSGATWQAYAVAPTFTLAGANGTHQIFFQVRSATGVESAVVSDQITLNEPVPAFTAFAINSGAGSTASRTVTLNNSATGGPTEYRASESSTFAGATWMPYSPAPTFTLSAGNVTKRVYIQLRSLAGTSLVRSDTILLAEPAPSVTSFLIDNGASVTKDRTVSLNNVATGAPTEYRASQSSTFTGAAWMSYSPAPTFVLSAGNVTKRVYIQVRNAAGVPSTVRSDTILLSE